jgi:hypothetical protein
MIKQNNTRGNLKWRKKSFSENKENSIEIKSIMSGDNHSRKAKSIDRSTTASPNVRCFTHALFIKN